MQKPGGGRVTAIACMIAATLGFGIIPIFLKHFAQFLDPWTVNGIRYSAGALFWLPFLLVLDRRSGGSGAAAPGRSVWRDAAVPSVVNVVGQAAFGIGPYFVPASTMGFVLRLSFLFTIVFGLAAIAEERLLIRQPAFWLGTVLSLAGVVAMFAEEVRGGVGSVSGLVIIVATAVAWGAYSVTVRRYMAGYSARRSFAVISLYSSASLVLLMLLFGRVGSLAEISAGLWANLMLSALIGIAFGHVLYYRGIHELGPVVASGMSLATPFVTCLAAAILLGERLSGIQWIGGLLVVFGGGFLVLARARIERSAPQPSPDLDDHLGD
jgi:drug/metabolite transporter (DMT)-like permease